VTWRGRSSGDLREQLIMPCAADSRTPSPALILGAVCSLGV
jgi:hypothetical protein